MCMTQANARAVIPVEGPQCCRWFGVLRTYVRIGVDAEPLLTAAVKLAQRDLSTLDECATLDVLAQRQRTAACVEHALLMTAANFADLRSRPWQACGKGARTTRPARW